MSKYWMLFAFIIISNFGPAQSDRTFSEDELREDLRFLKKSIETYNPALGIFHRKDKFDSVYDSLCKALDSKMTDLQFYSLAARPKLQRILHFCGLFLPRLFVLTDLVFLFFDQQFPPKNGRNEISRMLF